ncbi:hypothetical protein [Kitasatospora kifunensis]|uniref:Uncharacterized protein n=1 Tax=Kitasatospora kifunensis TaxID=58351 RepID=A0A7W7R9H6_KITKI|nr:hypothetical protein [Kitasatospora kifunensis]MBB4927799.1 hypothetical protein [Kitasatospora kifunensis]
MKRSRRLGTASRTLPVLTALLLVVGVTMGQSAVAATAAQSTQAPQSPHPPQSPATTAGSARAAAGAAGPANGSWISYTGGQLVYGTDAQGNRIPDYSYAGYGGGGVPLPQVATRITVPPPSGGDDTATIQNALNQAAALPLDANGFRGAVQLSIGQYQLAGTLSINASGVVLRGADGNSADSELVATGATSRTLIQIGSTSAKYAVVGTAQNVTDNYVPVGGTVLTLASTTGFAVGDQVVVQRPTTQAWIDAMGMTSYWTANWSLYSERTITAVNGNQITIDAPLTTALEQQYTQASVYHYTFPRIDHVGIENLSADGQAMTADPNYATDFYNSSLSEFNAVQDSWMTNVFTHHFGQNGVTGLNSQSRRISVVHTGALDMVVNTATSARSDGYTLQGQQNLIQDCQLSGTKVHAFETEARQSGPNVYSDCTATSTNTSFDSGGHQRWGSGTLYDDITIAGGSLNMENYGSEGTGHGWGDGNSTAWNCNVGSYLINSPPTAHNWAIGCTGTENTGSTGEIQNPGSNVLPQSLYNEQLAERLGTATPANDFSLDSSPSAGSVTAGQSATATVSTAVTSGSAQLVALTAAGLPSGATASFSPASVTAGGSAALSLATTAATPAGSYPITITGTGASATRTATYTLTVTTSGPSCTSAQLLGNPGFENGTNTAPWTQTSTTGSSPINNDTADEPAHSGSWDAWLDGNSTPGTDTVAQTVTIPAGCTATLSYWLHVDTTESTSSATPDTLDVQLLDSSGAVLSTVATYSNLKAATGYTQYTADLSAYAGQSVTLSFSGTETDANGGTTSFVIDDTALNVTS